MLQLVDSPNDLKFELAASTLGREMAVRAQEGAGSEGWWTFRRRVEANGPEGILTAISASVEVPDLTKRNVDKALQFRTAPEAVDAQGEAEEGVERVVVAPVHPATRFLDRAYHHYLHTVATLRLATAATPDPTRSVKQLTQRLAPSDTRGAPRPVLTVPLAGRAPQAGQRTDGWATELSAVELDAIKRGGPITRAKGARAREARRSVFTGTKTSEEELAGAV